MLLRHYPLLSYHGIRKLATRLEDSRPKRQAGKGFCSFENVDRISLPGWFVSNPDEALSYSPLSPTIPRLQSRRVPELGRVYHVPM
jgi:hypothetical protein